MYIPELSIWKWCDTTFFHGHFASIMPNDENSLLLNIVT